MTNSIKKVLHREHIGKLECWEVNGILHNDNGPAEIDYFNKNNDGSEPVRKKSWYQNGKLHRENSPAVIEYFEDGTQLRSEQWWEDGELHRIDEPAYISYWPINGKIKTQRWHIKGKKLHPFNGPAVTMYNNAGIIIQNTWYDNDVPHRLEGAAEITFHPTATRRRWIFYGIDVTGNEIRKLLNIKAKIPGRFSEKQQLILKEHYNFKPETS